MAFTQLTDDLSIISKLPDEPNDSVEHDGTWLKGQFDAAGNAIKTYINGTLLTELGGTGAAANIGTDEITGLVSDPDLQSVLEAIYQVAEDAQGGIVADESITTAKLHDTAVTTTKIADANVTHAKLSDNAVESNNIGTGAVVDGKLANNSVNRANIKDGAVTSEFTATIPAEIEDGGETVSAWEYDGPPYMNEIECTGMVSGDPVTWACTSADEEVLAAYALCTFVADDDAILVSSDDAITLDIPISATQGGTTYIKTVLAADWLATDLPMKQEITVSGLLATDKPIVDIDLSAVTTFADAEEALEAYGYIYRMVAGADKLTLYATEETLVDVNIKIKAVRK